MQKKKKKKSEYTIIYFFGTLILCGVLIFIITIGGNLLSAYIVSVRAAPVTTQPTIVIPTTTDDSEPIILGTIEKLTSANVVIVITAMETAKIGSGTIIADDGENYTAITNAHVLTGAGADGTGRSVRSSDGVVSGFEIISIDEEKDLALIRFPKTHRSEIIPLQISTETEVDDLIIAIGNPQGEIGTISIGNITRFGTYDELGIVHEVIIHTATIGSGSSGGALCNLYGNLIGINTWSNDGEFYSIPASVIQSFIETQI